MLSGLIHWLYASPGCVCHATQREQVGEKEVFLAQLQMLASSLWKQFDPCSCATVCKSKSWFEVAEAITAPKRLRPMGPRQL
jgi:hypothetical protein